MKQELGALERRRVSVLKDSIGIDEMLESSLESTGHDE